MADMNFGVNLLPTSDLGFNLGNSSKRWNIYGKLNGNADSATTVPKALTSNGTTATTNSGYTYGIAGVTSGNRIYSKWYVNLDNGIKTLTDGMLIEIKIPVAGSSSGCAITIDNGTSFHPVIHASSSIITTHFSVNNKILLMYDSTGTGNVYGKIDGSTATSAASITGVWRVMNLYTDGNTYTSAYCSTSASTAAKTATCSGYYLLPKSQIHVIITTTNTAASALTLNINGQGAKPIYINGTASSSSNYNLPRGSYLVYYDGTNYHFRTDGAITGNLTGNAATATALQNARTIQTNLASTDAASFNGGANITPGVTGTLGAANGGTGKTTLKDACNAFINALDTGNVNKVPVDGDYYISQYIGGGTTSTAYYRRPMSTLWSYIKGKTDATYAAKSHTHSYAGSASAGGSANSAVKLDTTTAGSSTQPVYFSGGKPVAITGTISNSTTGNASTATKLQTARTISLTGSVTGSGTFDGSGNLSIATTTNHTHSYLPLSGGTMTGNIIMSGSVLYPHSNSMIQAAPSSTTYYEPVQWFDKDNKRIGAIGTTSYANGDFATHIQVQREINGTNHYQQLYMIIGADGTGFCRTTKMYGAVWNDYAEFRICNEDFKPGQVVLENGDDTLSIASQRLQRGCSIVSDTFGFAIGETDEAKCPIAVSGRVLAYGYESREEFKKHIGWPVCSGPNGTVSIMTEEEEEKYPSRIIGTISAVPDYETWGTGNVEVNNRIWIKVK